jgi:hypothetical protein
LLLDGKRKSIQPMAERLPDGNEQALQQFISQSPWDWRPVRQRLATQMTAVVDPDAWWCCPDLIWWTPERLRAASPRRSSRARYQTAVSSSVPR